MNIPYKIRMLKALGEDGYSTGNAPPRGSDDMHSIRFDKLNKRIIKEIKQYDTQHPIFITGMCLLVSSVTSKCSMVTHIQP